MDLIDHQYLYLVNLYPVIACKFKHCSSYLNFLQNKQHGSTQVVHTLTFKKQPREVFYKKAIKNFAIFTGNHLCWSLFFQKCCNFIRKRLQHRCFPVSKPILKNICERLLLWFRQYCFLGENLV